MFSSIEYIKLVNLTKKMYNPFSLLMNRWNKYFQLERQLQTGINHADD